MYIFMADLDFDPKIIANGAMMQYAYKLWVQDEFHRNGTHKELAHARFTREQGIELEPLWENVLELFAEALGHEHPKEKIEKGCLGLVQGWKEYLSKTGGRYDHISADRMKRL